MAALTFDDVPAAAPRKGPLTFDDVPAAGPRVERAAPIGTTGPRADPNAPAAAPAPSAGEYAADMAQAVPTGIAKLISETAMFPITALRESGLAEERMRQNYKMVDGKAVEQAPDAQAWYDRPLSEMLGMGEDPLKGVRESVYGGQDTARGIVDENTYQPHTLPGKLTEEGVQWVVPALAPTRATRLMEGVPRLTNYAADVLTHGVAPWAASEGVEKLSGNKDLGAMAGLFSALSMGALRRSHTPEAQIRRDFQGTPANVWDDTINLQETAPIDLTPAEAHAQVTGQADTAPLKTQRFIESSPVGSQESGPFMANREGQVDAAFNDAMNQIAPQPQHPDLLGPRVSAGANEAVRDVERNRREQTEPLYAQADPQQVPADQIQGVIDDLDKAIAADTTGQANPVLRQFREALIATPATPGRAATRTEGGAPGIYRQTPAIPPTPERPALDIQNIDTARKAFAARNSPGFTGLDAIPAHQRGLLTPFLQRLDAIMQGTSDEYTQGKNLHEQVTRTEVDPATHGPLGQLAEANTTEGVGNVLVPDTPVPNRVNDMVDAIQRVLPRVAELPQAVRQRLETMFHGNEGSLGGNRQGVGAAFAKLFQDPVARQNLEGVLHAASGGALPGNALDNMLQSFEATGRRLKQGSPTQTLTSTQHRMEQSPALSTVSTALGAGGGVSTALSALYDIAKLYTLQGNTRRLAELGFGSARNLRGTAERAWDSLIPEVLSRTGVSALAQSSLPALFSGGDQRAER